MCKDFYPVGGVLSAVSSVACFVGTGIMGVKGNNLNSELFNCCSFNGTSFIQGNSSTCRALYNATVQILTCDDLQRQSNANAGITFAWLLGSLFLACTAGWCLYNSRCSSTLQPHRFTALNEEL